MNTSATTAGSSKAPEASRREFLQVLAAGLMIAVTADGAIAQSRPATAVRGRRGGGDGARTIAARIHIGQDGTITVMTGKVECGQGARAELTQAAAEELRVSPNTIQLIMADTGLVPDDGGTSGSQSTPSTVPAIRKGCAAARGLLLTLAAKSWGAEAGALDIQNGKVTDPKTDRSMTYGDLAKNDELTKAFAAPMPADVTLTAVETWKVMGTSVPRPNGRDIVTGAHRYPSDIRRPGMLSGKILRQPSFGAKLLSIDLAAAKAIKGVVVVQDGLFVGVAAPTAFIAEEAIAALAETAKWETSSHPSSAHLSGYLRQHARGGIPKNPFDDEIGKAANVVNASYDVAYVQHCPMEPRAAVAEWVDGKLTVWTGTQQPFGVKGELARTLNIAAENVRVIVPDFGGGFGGKHSGECAVEAARLAQAFGRPVSLRWTREEEFTWAYFRPAGVIDAAATLDGERRLTSWHFINVNSGGNEVQTPYRVAKSDCRFVGSEPPLKHGSYRALAVTANNFARESFMDECALAAGQDPLAFRLAHLENGRLRDVLEDAARRFDWIARVKNPKAGAGIGMACGLDKGSYVAACVEVIADVAQGTFKVSRICQTYECGKIINPANLLSQVRGAIVMGLGPALREEMIFEDGKISNASLRKYKVPRFEDVPELDIHLLDRPELPSTGAGETPIIAVAPAVANALFAATGQRIRRMPIKLPKPASH
jgi:CO/xanthine dehydrogenase Mo-binding subunit